MSLKALSVDFQSFRVSLKDPMKEHIENFKLRHGTLMGSTWGCFWQNTDIHSQIVTEAPVEVPPYSRHLNKNLLLQMLKKEPLFPNLIKIAQRDCFLLFYPLLFWLVSRTSLELFNLHAKLLRL